MEVKVSQVLMGKEVVTKLIDMKLPVATAFKLGRLVAKVDAEIKIFDEQRMKLIKENGDPLENDQYKIKDENIEAFNKDIQEMLDQQITIEDNMKIKIDALGTAELTARDLMILDWLIVQE